MYTIEQTSYGFKITQKGSFTIDQVRQYKAHVIRVLSRHDQPFSMLIDSREIVLPEPEVLEVFAQLHSEVWQMGCERSAIIVKSPVARDMAALALTKTTIIHNDRIIDARKCDDWEKRALAWIEDGVEPETYVETDTYNVGS